MTVEQRRIAENADVMVKQVDRNKDNQIGGDEAGNWLTDLREQGKLTEGMRSSIANADTDKNGTLSPEELTKAMIANEGFRELLLEMRAVKEAIIGQVPAGKQPPQKQRPQVAPLPAATAP